MVAAFATAPPLKVRLKPKMEPMLEPLPADGFTRIKIP